MCADAGVLCTVVLDNVNHPVCEQVVVSAAVAPEKGVFGPGWGVVGCVPGDDGAVGERGVRCVPSRGGEEVEVFCGEGDGRGMVCWVVEG